MSPFAVCTGSTASALLPRGGFRFDWLTLQARYVRGQVPRRAMHASGDSPCRLSAKHHILRACFPRMAPFRTRFSPRRVVHAAYVQRLTGYLYTQWWYSHILTSRFHGTAVLPDRHTVSPHRKWGRACALPSGGYFPLALALSGLVGPPGAAVLHEQGAIFLDSAPPTVSSPVRFWAFRSICRRFLARTQPGHSALVAG